MIISACGIICSECQFFNKDCTGCQTIKGHPFWTSDATENKICQLFDCAVNKKQYEHCGKCSDLPCKKFYELKDPALTDAEHLDSILKRVSRLRDQF